MSLGKREKESLASSLEFDSYDLLEDEMLKGFSGKQ
jgi:hypothetical protein